MRATLTYFSRLNKHETTGFMLGDRPRERCPS
jgi:hypothetical protein